MLNQTVLTGNLGADPETYYNPQGSPVSTFNLAFRSSKKKTPASSRDRFLMGDEGTSLGSWGCGGAVRGAGEPGPGS